MTNFVSKHLRRTFLGGVSLLAIGMPAFAAGTANNGPTEVVVTATKRTTSLQATPISLSVVTGAQLVKQGVPNIAALAAATPGVSVDSEGPGRSNYDVRGMSNSGGSSATVGFYLDDVPITPPTSALAAAGKSEVDPDLYDLARVEVLRGPQGTLYGASSMGGTIRLITNQPKLDRIEASGETIGSGTEGGGANYAQNAMVNVPLIRDELAVRVIGTDKYDSGYINRIVVSPFPAYTGSELQNRGNVAGAPVIADYKDVNNTSTQSVRVLMLYRPIEEFTVTPSFFTQRISQNGQDSIDIPPGNFAHYQPGDQPERFMQAFRLYSLTAKYDLPGVSLQSSTAEFHGQMYNLEDTQEQWFGLTEGFGSAPYFPTPGSGEEDHRQKQLTEEFRASTTGNGKLQGIAGIYFSDYKDQLHYNEYDDGLTPLFGTSSVFTDQEPDELKQAAVFADATYAIRPDLKFDAGLRWFHYDFTYSQNLGGIVAGPPLVASGGASASGVTPKFNVNYTPTRDLTLFATAAEGFRPGGPNLPVPASYCGTNLNALGLNAAPASFSPDSVWSYELGEKSRMMQGALQVRASGYYIDWSQIQQTIQLACGYNFNANAGHASSKGGEVEIEAHPTTDLTLHANFGYTRAQITSSDFASVLPVGTQLQNVPEWTYDLAAEYDHPLTDTVSAMARIEDSYVGKVNDYSAEPYPITTRAGYSLVNLRVGLEMNKISAYLYADNLFNSKAIVGFDHSEAQNTPEFARAIPTRPLTAGLDLQYHY